MFAEDALDTSDDTDGIVPTIESVAAVADVGCAEDAAGPASALDTCVASCAGPASIADDDRDDDDTAASSRRSDIAVLLSACSLMSCLELALASSTVSLARSWLLVFLDRSGALMPWS